MNETDLPPRIRQAADISEITQLILTERESRDLGHWTRMRDCFHDDALIRISWITGDADAFVEGSRDMARRGVLATHRLGPIRVHLGGDRAVASLTGIIDIPAKVGDVDVQLSSHARFLYRAERRDGRWRLSGFDGIYRRDELVPVVPGQSLRIDPAELSRFRASYRLLSYVLSRNGYPVNGDLPGEDRPESATALENELLEWAGIATVARRSDREIVVTRLLDAPAAAVYEAWSRPEIFSQWWLPRSLGMTLLSCRMDVHVGGGYRLEIRHPAAPQPMAFFGRYLDVVPRGRLVWTNEEGGEAGPVTTVTFEEKDGRTRVVVTELHPTKESLDAAGSGPADALGESFAQLEALLRSG